MANRGKFNGQGSAVGTALLAVLMMAGLPAHGVTTDTPVATRVAMARHSAGTFYVQGSLTGYGDINLLVDTGSSLMAISKDMLDAMKSAGTAHSDRELQGLMADGSTRRIPVYRLDGLRIGEDCWIDNIEAAVIAGLPRPILGMNILERLSPFTFSPEVPAYLVLTQCQSSTSIPYPR